MTSTSAKPDRPERGVPLRRADKVARIPVKVVPRAKEDVLKKPSWLKVKLPTASQADKVRDMLRNNKLYTVCEEASCPNLPECFGHGTATFMILGQVCTRRCPFCDVGHGRPLPVDEQEPAHLADTIQNMNLNYVVITSVDRDDLRDGGAKHFADCVRAARAAQPGIKVEILTPDFRGRMDIALDEMSVAPPDVFNHNMETVPRLYKKARPGADYQWSLDLLQRFGERHPEIPTKSGLMVGLGEELDEIKATMQDLRAHGVRMLTIGQYLAPSDSHLPIERYYSPDEFEQLREYGEHIGFDHVASAPLVRSSYHADQQAKTLV